MTLLQVCFAIFFTLGFYFWVATDWRQSGDTLMKGAASFFVSFVIALIVFIGVSVFKWIGE